MLKTNSKIARQHVLEHIRTTASDYLTECGYSIATDAELCTAIKAVYRAEFWHLPMTQANFKQWGSGLACGGLFDYFLFSAVNVLGDILEETAEERNRYTEEQAENVLTYLIYREVTRTR